MSEIKYILYLNWNYSQALSSQSIWIKKKQFDFSIPVLGSADNNVKFRVQSLLDPSGKYKAGSVCKIPMFTNGEKFTGRAFTVRGDWSKDELSNLSQDELYYSSPLPTYLIPIKGNENIGVDANVFYDDILFVDEIGTTGEYTSSIDLAYSYVSADLSYVLSGAKKVWRISLFLSWFSQSGLVPISNMYQVVDVSGSPDVNQNSRSSVYNGQEPVGIWVDRTKPDSSQRVENNSINSNISFLSIAKGN